MRDNVLSGSKMNDRKDGNVDERIDKQCAELWSEFKQHVDKFTRANPGMSDKGKIFDGWIIQKVAGLQCLAIDFEERISTLESRTR